MSLKRYLAYVIDFFIEGIIGGFLFWLFCYVMSLISNSKTSDLYFSFLKAKVIKFNILGIAYRFGFNTIFALIVSVLFVSIFVYLNNGYTIGDKIMKIRIKSSKYSNMKFYLLRFFLRTFTITFILVFAIFNIICIFIYKRLDVCWYDKILGIEVIHINNKFGEPVQKIGDGVAYF